MIDVRLPAPPTVNGLYRNNPGKGSRGRAHTQRYTQWIVQAGLMLNTQATEPMPGNVKAAIELPDTLRGDIDGYAKATLDLLVRHRLIDDDRYVRELWMAFCERTDMRVRVEQC